MMTAMWASEKTPAFKRSRHDPPARYSMTIHNLYATTNEP